MSKSKDELNFLESFKEKISANLTDIENRDDLSESEKAQKIIHIFSATCAGIAVQPIPFADFFILTTVQGYMAERLAAVHGVPVSKSNLQAVISDVAKTIGLGMLAQQTALGLYKTGLPFLAGFTTIPLVYGLTYAIGNVFSYIFSERAKGRKVSPSVIKELWGKAKKEGKKRGAEHRDNK
jgi:uncharacterized protein (DUF697 family)